MESNSVLHWSLFTSLSNWLTEKLEPPLQPIRCETVTNSSLVTRVFPRFRQFARLSFELLGFCHYFGLGVTWHPNDQLRRTLGFPPCNRLRPNVTKNTLQKTLKFWHQQSLPIPIIQLTGIFCSAICPWRPWERMLSVPFSSTSLTNQRKIEEYKNQCSRPISLKGDALANWCEDN